MRTLLCLLVGFGSCLAVDQPRVLDPGIELSLFAAEPDIVTPVGATFDAKGRLLVVECHTHFPPEGYAGPKVDRIRLIEDRDGDGRADQFRSFYEGGKYTMSLRAGPNGWIYVATRSRIFRLKDTDADDKADKEEELLRLETKGDYPHNGLGGLAFDASGRLYFGLGENIGFPYEVIAADGSKFAGGGEGGSIFRCDSQGKGLERVATGFWNPFGICVDPFGRIFEVGNDPDSRPPCRLAQVAEGGDYGYAFRYGRSGLHPLQAWNGELPGSLPMAAGTGEAPCNVIPWRGNLWVTVWGDYRIERYTLIPSGASCRASREIVVQGNDQFRPVDFAVSPDGSAFVTDWVDKSYPVHGKGRIWRLRWKSSTPEVSFPGLSPDEEKAKNLAATVDLEALKSDDPYLRQAAVRGLTRSQKRSEISWDRLEHPRQRLGLLQANRWLAAETESTGEELLPKALRDPDAEVRLYAVRWIADRKLSRFRGEFDRMLGEPVMSPALFQGLLAAIEWMDSGEAKPKKDREDYLCELIRDKTRAALLRATALRLLPGDSLKLSLEELATLARDQNPALKLAALRCLALRGDPKRRDVLLELIKENESDPEAQADAFLGLAGLTPSPDEELLPTAKGALKREVQRLLSPAPAESKPPADDLAAWKKLLAEGGDARAGWRVFFGANAGTCASCHAYHGQGNSLGPDLGSIGHKIGRDKLLESILQPSREIAPRYVPWVVSTKDGKEVAGFAAHQTELPGTESYVGVDGKRLTLLSEDITQRKAASFSIMPAGLEQRMSLQDFRDLLRFLESRD